MRDAEVGSNVGAEEGQGDGRDVLGCEVGIAVVGCDVGARVGEVGRDVGIVDG